MIIIILSNIYVTLKKEVAKINKVNGILESSDLNSIHTVSQTKLTRLLLPTVLQYVQEVMTHFI